MLPWIQVLFLLKGWKSLQGWGYIWLRSLTLLGSLLEPHTFSLTSVGTQQHDPALPVWSFSLFSFPSQPRPWGESYDWLSTASLRVHLTYPAKLSSKIKAATCHSHPQPEFLSRAREKDLAVQTVPLQLLLKLPSLRILLLKPTDD